MLENKNSSKKRLLGFIILLTLGMATPDLCHSQEEIKPFKLAMAQMRVVGGELETNLAHAAEMIEEAAKQGAQVVLLPEAMDLGWTDPSALTMAKKHQIYVCSGLTEKDGEKVYNSVDREPPGTITGISWNRLPNINPVYTVGNFQGAL